MAETVVWALACVLMVAIVVIGFCWAVDRIDRRRDKVRQHRLVQDKQQQEVELLERRTAAELNAATADQHAELRRAELALQAVQANADAQVANAETTIQARIAEQERIIQARAEGRAEAAREVGLRQAEGSQLPLEVLVRAYTECNDIRARRGQNPLTFDEWLGSVEVESDGTVRPITEDE